MISKACEKMMWKFILTSKVPNILHNYKTNYENVIVPIE